MKLSKTDCFVLDAFINYVVTKKDICQLNEKGVEKLAKIHSLIGARLLDVDAKAVYPALLKNLLENINYSE